MVRQYLKKLAPRDQRCLLFVLVKLKIRIVYYFLVFGEGNNRAANSKLSLSYIFIIHTLEYNWKLMKLMKLMKKQRKS